MGDSKLNEMPTQVIGNEKMPWTDERVELLKKLWTEGHSASQIAARLGMGVTRNAVIGKVHRLNLSGRVTQPRSTEPRAPRKTREPSHPGRPVGSPSMPSTGNTALKTFVRVEPIQRQIALPEPQPLRLVDLPKGGRVTILHLSDKTCKWRRRSRLGRFLLLRPFPGDKSPCNTTQGRLSADAGPRHRKFAIRPLP
jgi:GcrA cell cycle regulator